MIRIQFVAGTDAGAHLIAWFGGGAPFSHVDSILPDGRLLGSRSDVVGGAPAGVQIRDPGYVGHNKTLRIDVPADDAMTAAYHGFLASQLGKPYDIEGILGFIAGRNWHDPSAWFCSELAAAGLEACGLFKWPLAVPSNKITPPGLILVLSTLTQVKLAA